MNCLCERTAHVVGALGVPTQPVDPAREAALFRDCTARTPDVRRFREWELSSRVLLAQAVLASEAARSQLVFNQNGEPFVRWSGVAQLMDAAEREMPWFLVPRASQARRFGDRGVVSWTSELAPGSLVWVQAGAEGLLMPSPEFQLLLRAGRADLLTLCRLVCEACGLYRTRPDLSGGMERCQPRTTLSRISAFLDRVPKGAMGLANLRRALALSVDRSGSPRETALVLMLTLPARLGGFGLPKPVMNQLVVLSPEGAALLGVPRIKPDLLWPDAQFGYEYQGSGHRDPGVQEVDAERGHALSLKQVEAVEVTAAMVSSWEQVNALAERARRALRLSRRRFTDRQKDLQEHVRQTLLAFDYVW